MYLNKEKIFVLRAERELTTKQLAKLAGVSTYEFSKKDKPIGAIPAGKIAWALKVPVEDIIERADV